MMAHDTQSTIFSWDVISGLVLLRLCNQIRNDNMMIHVVLWTKCPKGPDNKNDIRENQCCRTLLQLRKQRTESCAVCSLSVDAGI